jgi:hypothetical protein
VAHGHERTQASSWHFYYLESFLYLASFEYKGAFLQNL